MSSDEVTVGGLRTAFRALESKNYRIFFIGQLVSLIGTWVSSTALGWLVFRLTQSESWLGMINFTGQFPALLVGLVTGVVADRFDRIKILLGTQFFSMLQSFALAWVVWHPHPSLAAIFMLSVVQGVITGFDMPARQSLMPQLVERKEDLSNAIALNAAMFNTARLIGPVAAGAILSVTTEAVCFFIDGLTFLAVLIALTRIKIPPRAILTAEDIGAKVQRSILADFIEGLKFSYGDKEIRSYMMLLSGIGLFGVTPIVLMPVITKVIFSGDARLLGLLLGTSGAGALTGALFLASRHHSTLRSILRRAAFAAAGGLIILSQSTSLYITFPFIFMEGFSVVLTVAICSTLIQLKADDRMRGRVSSMFAMTWLGSMPIGALFMGFVAETFEVSFALLIAGLFLLAIVAAVIGLKKPQPFSH